MSTRPPRDPSPGVRWDRPDERRRGARSNEPARPGLAERASAVSAAESRARCLEIVNRSAGGVKVESVGRSRRVHGYLGEPRAIFIVLWPRSARALSRTRPRALSRASCRRTQAPMKTASSVGSARRDSASDAYTRIRRPRGAARRGGTRTKGKRASERDRRKGSASRPARNARGVLARDPYRCTFHECARVGSFT